MLNCHINKLLGNIEFICANKKDNLYTNIFYAIRLYIYIKNIYTINIYTLKVIKMCKIRLEKKSVFFINIYLQKGIHINYKFIDFQLLLVYKKL